MVTAASYGGAVEAVADPANGLPRGRRGDGPPPPPFPHPRVLLSPAPMSVSISKLYNGRGTWEGRTACLSVR